MKSTTFNLGEDSQDSIHVQDLHLMNREKLEANPVIYRVYVGELQQIKKPFLEQIKPHLSAFLSGAATTAETAGGYGLKAFSAIKGAFWWSYQGIKSLFTKTAQYIQPKFVLITQKLQNNNQQLQTIQKVSKDVAVLGLDEYKQLAPIKDGKVQIAVPIDQEFLNFLRNEKMEMKQASWEPNMETTKTIIAPSQSFCQIFQEIKSQKVPIKFNNLGGFCTFEFEGQNEIEYQSIQKLRLGNNLLQGYLVPIPQKVQSIKSQTSGPGTDPEAVLTVEEKQEHLEKKQQQHQQVPRVKSVQGVNLYPQQFSSQNMKLEFA